MKGSFVLDKEKNTESKINSLAPFFFTVIFAVISAMLQTMTVLFSYESVAQVYKRGSALSVLSVVLMLAMCVAVSVMWKVQMKKSRTVSTGKNSYLSSLFGACSGLLVIISSIILYIEGSSKLNAQGAQTIKTISTLLMVTSLPCGAYLFISGIKKRLEKLLSILGFFPVIWTVICLLRIYFDNYSVINDPIRKILQISFAALMLAFLYEYMINMLGEGGVYYVVSTSVAVILGTASSISQMLLYFITKTVSAGEALLGISQMILCFYLIIKLYYNTAKN